MAEREVRIARTEALFRDVNERIAESAERFSARDAEFVCECADPACAERVPATLELYEDVGRPIPDGLVQDPQAGAIEVDLLVPAR